MNLQAILSHRTNCLICGNEMKCHAPEYPKLLFYIDEKGMKITSGHSKHGIRMFFGFDGKYTRTKQNYKIYQEPLIITKHCDECYRGKIEPFASTQHFFTSINNMKSKKCLYGFQIMVDARGNYDSLLNYELVKYHDNKAFYHLDTSYLSGSSVLHHGNFVGSIEDVLILRIPSVVNLGNVKNIDQFLSKYKMYMLMS